MKLYLIKNASYDDKKVAADNMEEALHKYRDYLETAISQDYSSEKVFQDVSECKYLGIYQEDSIIK